MKYAIEEVNVTMIEIIKSFLNKCDGNEELTSFVEGLIECWMHGYNAMYWNIENKNNLQIIKDFFAELYQDCPQLYQINDWFVPNNTRKEYEIKWYFNLEDIPTLEENK